MEYDVDLVTLIIGVVLGSGVPAIKALVSRSPNKLDDAVWNNMVNEFVAAGVIKPENLNILKGMPPK